MRYSSEIADMLANLVFNNCSMHTFLNQVENIIGNPIGFTSYWDNLYDSITSRSYPKKNEKITEIEFKQREQYIIKRMAQLNKIDPIYTDGGPGIPNCHILTMAQVADKHYGLIYIADGATPLKEIDVKLIKFIGKCIAQIQQNIIISHDTSIEVMLDKLLNNESLGDAQLKTILSLAPIAIDSEYQLLWLPYNTKLPLQVGAIIRDNIHAILKKCWCSWNTDHFTALYDINGAGLLHGENYSLLDLSELAMRFHSPLCISYTFSDFAECHGHYARMKVLPPMRKAIEGQIVFMADYLDVIMFMETTISSTDIVLRIKAVIQKIIEYDKEHHTYYYHTLAAYIRNRLNAIECAKEMHVHANTIGYRIKKAQELFDFNLADPTSLFTILFALRIYDYHI